MWLFTIPLMLCVLLSSADSQDKKPKKARPPAYTNEQDAGPDFQIQGEYEGEILKSDEKQKFAAQVIARGDCTLSVKFFAGGLPGARAADLTEVAEAQTENGRTLITSKKASGEITKDMLTGVGGTATKFMLHRVVRKSPTLGAKPPKGAIVLFDGSSADEWNGGKLVEDNLLNNGITSKKKFKDFTLHLEFRLPFMPTASGQGRANSGVYLQDRYELQVLDSFGLKGENNECGGFYSQTAPSVNMCFPPLSWQTYDVDFKAARYDKDGKKTANARATVRHNGVIIHQDVELLKELPGGKKEEDTPGPIQLQNHGDRVYFRNIWVVESK